jgi:hypothetical protein
VVRAEEGGYGTLITEVLGTEIIHQLHHHGELLACQLPYHRDSDSVTLLGAILGAIESLTCGTHMSVAPHVSDSMALRMAPSNVTESQSILFVRRVGSLDLARVTPTDVIAG